MSEAGDDAEPLDEHELVEVATPAPAHASDDETTAHRVLPPARESDDEPTGRVEERSLRAGRPRRVSTTSPQEAELFDAVVVPHWIAPQAALVLSRVPEGFRGQILDASAGTGHVSLALLARVEPSARIVALESDTALLALLRRRCLGATGRQVFPRAEELSELGFKDEVFDLVVAAAFPAIRERAVAAELRRVMAPGARLIVSMPLRGSFEEVLDLMAEVASRRGGALPGRVAALRERAPDGPSLATSLRRLGFDPVDVQVVERQLVFRSVKELFHHPAIAHAALAEWRVAAGFDDGGEDVLGEVELAFSTYVPRGPVSITVQVGVIEAARP